MAPDIRVYTIAEQLLACAYEQVSQTDGGEPTRACVVAGALAWDSCGGGCSQLTISLNNIYAASSFPVPAETTASQFGGNKCGHPMVVATMTATILRCVPGPGPNGEPPSCEDLAEAALIAVQDAAAVRAGVECCLMDMATRVDGVKVITGWTTGSQNFLGPEGFCGGSQLPIRVGILNNCACGD